MSYIRGDVVLVDLEPTIGSEQGFKRPCIVISDLTTILESHSRPLYVIIPLTRAAKLEGKLAPRLAGRESGLPSDSTALIMHLRSIDPRRVLKLVCKLEKDEIIVLQEGLKELFKL
jgi:mRNA interferase MazF